MYPQSMAGAHTLEAFRPFREETAQLIAEDYRISVAIANVATTLNLRKEARALKKIKSTGVESSPSDV
jgi:hypothetical protein